MAVSPLQVPLRPILDERVGRLPPPADSTTDRTRIPGAAARRHLSPDKEGDALFARLGPGVGPERQQGHPAGEEDGAHPDGLLREEGVSGIKPIVA